MTTPRTYDTVPHLEWAQTQTFPYAAPAPTPAPAPSGVAADTAPALNPPTWSGRKTAIAAALAIGISSVGAVGAAAAIPAGSTAGGGQVQQGGFGPVGRQQRGVTPPGMQQGSQLPGGPGAVQQAPGGASQAPGTQLQQSAAPNASTT